MAFSKVLLKEGKRGRVGERKDGKGRGRKIADTKRGLSPICPSLSVKAWFPGPRYQHLQMLNLLQWTPSTDAGLADMESPLCCEICLSWESLKTERKANERRTSPPVPPRDLERNRERKKAHSNP